jgi:hypothetical protein
VTASEGDFSGRKPLPRHGSAGRRLTAAERRIEKAARAAYREMCLTGWERADKDLWRRIARTVLEVAGGA